MLRRAHAALGSVARPLLQALGTAPAELRAQHQSSHGPAQPKSPADEGAEFLGAGQKLQGEDEGSAKIHHAQTEVPDPELPDVLAYGDDPVSSAVESALESGEGAEEAVDDDVRGKVLGTVLEEVGEAGEAIKAAARSTGASEEPNQN